jgi:hypothetical protein
MSTNKVNMTTPAVAPESDERGTTPDYGAWPTDEEVAAAGAGTDAAPIKSPIDDRFSLKRLRTVTDFASAVGLRKLITQVPVRKPSREWFVRTKGGEENRLQTIVLQLKEEGEIYLVDPDLWDDLADELVPMMFVTAINRQGVVFLWPVRMPDSSGRQNSWHESTFIAMAAGQHNWIRTVANRSLGGYDISEAARGLPEPEWPEATLDDLVKIAFQHRYVDSLEHPVVKMLRGQA